MVIKPYLFLYNLASAAGWAYVFYLTAISYLANDTPTQYWAKVGDALKITQTAAALEILHSILGLVSSPLSATFMQVSSRLGLLWVYTAAFTDCSSHWSVYLMVGSWSMVEIPRYLFYALNIYTKDVPYPLFFLRYSLFMVLYPSGISGELLQMYTSLTTLAATNMNLWYVTVAVLVLYVPGGPYMYMHMMSQRRRASKKRNESLKADSKKKK